MSRAAVLQALREAGEPTTAAVLADRLGVHVNTVRFHLDHLVDTGQVESAPQAQRIPGRPPLAYRIIPRMDPSGPRRFVELAQVLVADLAEEPDARDRAVELGRTWGRRVAAGRAATAGTEALVDVLDDLDFAPEPADGPTSTLRLHHCPFLELTEERTDVVCPMHLGLMQGVLQEWGSDVMVTDLDAFVEPDLCLVHVTEPEESR